MCSESNTYRFGTTGDFSASGSSLFPSVIWRSTVANAAESPFPGYNQQHTIYKHTPFQSLLQRRHLFRRERGAMRAIPFDKLLTGIVELLGRQWLPRVHVRVPALA